MSKIIELRDEKDLSKLQELLDHPGLSMYSLPTRHLLWYTRHGIIAHGFVYVDHWPEVNHVCALHTSEEFQNGNKKFDFDIVTFFSMHENAGSDFELFLRELASERRWTIDRSMWANYVLMPKLGIFEKVLSGHGKIVQYGAYWMYARPRNESVEHYRTELQGFASRLPEGLVADCLRESDVERLIQDWTYGPSKAIPDYFRWLVKTFPSVCLRNRAEKNELVAWTCMYSSGAGAHLYVDPKYRRKGVAEYLRLRLDLMRSEMCPLQQFGFISPENSISINAFKKNKNFRYEEGHEISLWFFFYNDRQYSKL